MRYILIALLVLPTSISAQWLGTNPVYFNAGNVGIGTSTPGAKLSFTNVDATSLADGITWYSPSPLAYGIYRTAGSWVAPNYQQLRLDFNTGIILAPGSSYSKSYVDIQGGGLRVSAGNVGIGTLSPSDKLTVAGGTFAMYGTGLDGSTYQRTVIYSDGTYGLLVEAPKNSSNAKMNIEFNWRGGGTPPLFVQGSTGNVGIGTNLPGTFKLAVEGKIGAREVNVTTTSPWPDFVFKSDYPLLSLRETKQFIQANGHLPNVPTASEVEANGIDLGAMNALLLQKVEELTLHLIQLKEENEQIKKEITKLKSGTR